MFRQSKRSIENQRKDTTPHSKDNEKKIILHSQGMEIIGILANRLELLGAKQRA